jgi:hypothetical protein
LKMGSIVLMSQTMLSFMLDVIIYFPSFVT